MCVIAWVRRWLIIKVPEKASQMSSQVRHFLDISSVEEDCLKAILKDSHELKGNKDHAKPLRDKMLAMREDAS